MKLDSKGTGRIPLDIFSRSDAGSAYEFTECFGAQMLEVIITQVHNAHAWHRLPLGIVSRLR